MVRKPWIGSVHNLLQAAHGHSDVMPKKKFIAKDAMNIDFASFAALLITFLANFASRK